MTEEGRAAISSLRTELADLKGCQVQYFSLAVTATGAIIGFATTATSPSLRGLGMLAPLALLLPCWLIFFDKATTITRIVGYQRLIEKECASSATVPSWLLAAETALGMFRRAQDEGLLNVTLPSGQPRMRDVLLLRTRHRYLMLNWYTFFSLSVASCLLGVNFLAPTSSEFHLPGLDARVADRLLAGAPALVLTAMVTSYTFKLVVRLVHGRDSYEANSLAWEALRRQNP